MINLNRVRARGMGCAGCQGTCGMGNSHVRRKGIGVMVCCDDEGNTYDDGTSTPDVLPVISPINNAGVIDTYTPPTYTPSSTPSASQVLSTISAITAPVLRAATQQAPYYIAGPNGQSVLYNPNTGAVAGSGVVNSLTSTATSMMPLLVLGGLVLMVMEMGKH